MKLKYKLNIPILETSITGDIIKKTRKEKNKEKNSDATV